MTQLVLLVVAAAWLAVLIPPMLRSRVQNRPNSSVTDFRDQLTKLQSTTTPARGTVRGIGRPLSQSPLSRPVAAGRQPQPVLRSGVTRRPTESELAAVRDEIAAPSQSRSADLVGDAPRFRSHGDPTGGQRRPNAFDAASARADREPRRDAPQRREAAARREPSHRDEHGPRSHGDPTGGQRRAGDPTTEVKRRRSNILFALVVTTSCSLFLAATTSSDVMLYIFVVAFLALSAYVYLLAQQNGGRQTAPSMQDSWSDSY